MRDKYTIIRDSLQGTYGKKWVSDFMADIMANHIQDKIFSKARPRGGSYFDETFQYIWINLPGGSTAYAATCALFNELGRSNEIEAE